MTLIRGSMRILVLGLLAMLDLEEVPLRVEEVADVEEAGKRRLMSEAYVVRKRMREKSVFHSSDQW